jgi:hypothetical protein
MKLTFTQFAAAAILATASTGALASPVAWNGSFALYDPTLGTIDGSNDVTGYIDMAAGTWSIASTTPFYGVLWTASGGTLYGPGTYTVNVNGDGLDAYSGDGNVTFTVGAGQLGGNIDVSWNLNNGIDVFQVWEVTTIPGVETLYTSIDGDGNGLPGMKIIDGPFVGLDVGFNMAAVPEASTYAMMLAGLCLVGGMVARRRT